MSAAATGGATRLRALPSLPADDRAAEPRPVAWRLLGLAALGVFAGSSSLWGGFYGVSTWGPAAIAVVLVLVVAVIAVPATPSRASVVLAGGLAAVAAWALASSTWADAGSAAELEAHRWALYAATAGVVALLAQTDRERLTLFAAIGLAGTVAAAVSAIDLGWGATAPDFFTSRLISPLGYVNGEAAALLLVLWSCLAVAERSPRLWLAGPAAAAGSVALGLLVLTESRGGFLALAATVLVLMAALPGRTRRGWLLLVVAAGAAVALGDLAGIYTHARDVAADPPDATVHHAVRVLLAGSAGAGAVWAAATAGAARVASRRASVVAALVLAAVVVAGAVAVVAATGDPVTRVERQWREFKGLQTDETAGASRLLSGGGNRYDYWRVALDEWRSAPVGGVGAGGYTRDYFRLRRSAEDVRQPHSIWLQALAETGVVGLALLLVAAAAAVAVVVGWVRARAGDPLGAGVSVAAVGSLVSWGTQTSVDWLHLLPGLTMCVVAGVAALGAPGPLAAGRGRGRVVGVGIVVALGCLAVAGIGRLTLAEHARRQARAALAEDPARTLDRARAALRLGGPDAGTRYLQAAAYARQDDYVDARAALGVVVDREPRNFVPHVLLGDLATRRGDRRTASAEYRTALALDPRDLALRQLAGQPAGRTRDASP